MRIIIFGILFLIVGLAACAVAFYLGRPESVKKSSIAKASSKIFYVIGALTFITGLMLLIFSNEMTKKAFQLIIIFYLFCVTVLLFIYTKLIKNGEKNETNNS